MTTQPAPANAVPDRAEQSLRHTLLSPGYLRLLLLCVLLGVPIALACFFFVGLQHELQHWVWTALPEAVGYDDPPWWWPLPALVLAGLILAPIVTRMPGGGGHLPVNGLGGAPVGPRALPGAVLAALATLPLGVVLGPEAPLMAVGSGLALLAVRRAGADADPRASAILATAGSTAAISTILGGPVVAAVLLIEGAGLGGAQLVALLLPCLLASATGALVFTGFGQWTGLKIGALALRDVPPSAAPDAGDFLWGVPTAALIAVLVTLARGLGRRTVSWTRQRTAVRTVVCAAAVGVCITAYALITGRSPAEAALSGQATLAQLAAHPHAWSVGALVALVACKGLAWGIALGSLRGGPIFPAVLLGTATALACSGLPGFGVTPALALGISAAAAAVTGLPLASAVLSVLLVGGDAHDQMPLIVTGSVVAFIVAQVARRTEPRADGEPGAGTEGGAPAGTAR
ncbi:MULTISPECIES: chloride channel protein [Streptomyces]|uniref:chloride channel protein n=1 Tax=Streptomyces TaxID=1883 RepID=UPI001E47DDB4|nr:MULTISPECIES: chloride channel protein [Streptomyces]WMI56849.1 chloride channel protein [Streptomyces rochei]WQC15498.1 chloride channel protein [Streptomyces rochei]